MLDDLKYIHGRDAQDALGIAEKQGRQLAHTFEVDLSGIDSTKIKNIVYGAMGGSALAALIAKSWPHPNLPFEVCRQYNLPVYTSDQTLFIASSYSGNTEETLSALAQAEARGAQIVVIAGGGKLVEIAKDKGHPLLLMPKAEQPRFAVLYNLKALVTVFEKLGLADNEASELNKTADFLEQAVQAWLPTVPTDKNPAKQLAMELAGKSVAVYAGPFLAPAAYKWKINFNENSKNVAWWNEVPEFDHNEINGWTSHPVQKPYAIVEFRSKFEHERVNRRFEVAEKLLSGRRPAPHTIEVQGNDELEQLLWAIAMGDFVSIYLALLNGVNPTPVDIVEKFKKDLG